VSKLEHSLTLLYCLQKSGKHVLQLDAKSKFISGMPHVYIETNSSSVLSDYIVNIVVKRIDHLFSTRFRYARLFTIFHK
jgi:hypothetical protein